MSCFKRIQLPFQNDQGPCIFEDNHRWSLAEENMLLDAVEQYGFGNWYVI